MEQTTTTTKTQAEWQSEPIAKTREEYDQMTKEELIEYSRKHGEKVQNCHKSDKNHRYPCGWCGKTPDETRIYVSPPNQYGQKDSRYLCYVCKTEEDQLQSWTELTDTSYWLPIRPPTVPTFNSGDPDLTCEAHDTPFKIRQKLRYQKMLANLPDNPNNPNFKRSNTVGDGAASGERGGGMYF